jgi:hypothetical protein
MRRGIVLLLTLLVVLAVAPAASADKPMREIIPGQDDVVITGQCAFPVLIHIEGREIITTFTDKAGDPVKQIVVFPGNKATLTNLDTGKSITVVTTGLAKVRLRSDGSVFSVAAGHGLFAPNPATGEPGIWYLSGRGTATVDTQGNLTSPPPSGKLVNLCARLAP